MKMNTQVFALVIAAVLATSAGAAFAQDTNMREERRAAAFAELDANDDGTVSAEEFAARANRFARIDTNGDGVLTAEELAAAGEERAARRAERMIARLDTNGDGALSEDEIKSRRDPSRMFEHLDANDDGMVSSEEFAEARMGGHGGKRGDHIDKRGGPFGMKRHGNDF
ncbi:MAG: calcium-binding protein [Marivita sp. XM-24bin2]|nr:EF-hand domain-containing protein [Marivita sp. XM-24bin2]PWL33644.1 MAG: calcium-binding protein [Marivita sp. XM-24bin2]